MTIKIFLVPIVLRANEILLSFNFNFYVSNSYGIEFCLALLNDNIRPKEATCLHVSPTTHLISANIASSCYYIKLDNISQSPTTLKFLATFHLFHSTTKVSIQLKQRQERLPCYSALNKHNKFTDHNCFPIDSISKMATDRRDDKAPALVQHELGSLKTSSGPITDGVVLEGNEIMLAETKHHIQDSESESKSHIKPFQQSKTSPEAPPFTTFLLFPRLPIELRLRIWSLVLPQSALVRIEACCKS